MPSHASTIVLSLGGSLIVPKEGIDTAFLRRFRALILRHAGKGRRFVIICGGGATARAYQKAAGNITALTRDDLDWIGIHATRLNAHLLRTVFRSAAHPRIITDPHEEMPTLKPVVIGAGWRPGCSTDFDAVLLARQYGATTLVNLSNIDYVYDKDPRTNADAVVIPSFTWKEFRKRFGGRWDPGLNSPFDPVAAKEAQKLKMRVIIADGRDFKNLEKIFTGKRFKGTVIS
ncbi:MAG: UMP kinase [Patescibacteria group bacterium]